MVVFPRMAETMTTTEGADFDHDVFISHASEDKATFVADLARALTDAGVRVWYDEWSLTLGDRLRRTINEGLKKSRFGVVVLSEHFFEKNWLQDELDGLAALEADGVNRILPIWLGVTRDDVLKYSPMLADRLAFNASRGIPDAVDEIKRAISRAPRETPPSQTVRRAVRVDEVNAFLRPRNLVENEGEAFGINTDSAELNSQIGEDGQASVAILSLVPVGKAEELDRTELWRWATGGNWPRIHPLYGSDTRPRTDGVIVRMSTPGGSRTRYAYLASDAYIEWGHVLGGQAEDLRVVRLGPLLWSVAELLALLADMKARFDIRADYELIVSVTQASRTVLSHLGKKWLEPWGGFREYRPVALDSNVQFRLSLPTLLTEEEKADTLRALDAYLNGVWGAGETPRGHDHPDEGGARSQQYRSDPWEHL